MFLDFDILKGRNCANMCFSRKSQQFQEVLDLTSPDEYGNIGYILVIITTILYFSP